MAEDFNNLKNTEEVFEIGDFTVVTPLEQFITLIEMALQDWDLIGKKSPKAFNKGIAKTLFWGSKSKVLKFHDANQLCMTHHYPIIENEDSVYEICLNSDNCYLNQSALDMRSPDFDFVHRSNITSMFGVCEFIVFSPVDPVEDNISTEDDVQYLRSAIRCAQQSSGSNIPTFVQFGSVDRQLFFGVSVDSDINITFEGALLRRGQSEHLNLSGLIGMFKSQVKPPSLRDATDIKVSVQLEFERRKPSSIGIFNLDVASVPFKLDSFAIGSQNSPLRSVHLIATWPNHSEDVIIENSLYSDLDPVNAFEWSFRSTFDSIDGEMSIALSSLLLLCEKKLGKKKTREVFGMSEAPGPLPFGQLAEGGSVRNIQIGATPSITNPGGLNNDFALMPLDDDEMRRWINGVFRFSAQKSGFSDTVPESLREKLNTFCASANAAPLHSVCSRLAVAFYHLSMNDVHPRNAHIQLWLQFVKELRRRFDCGDDVIDVHDIAEPNLLSCFLNQKLEMLQCCINARRQRHNWYNNAQHFGNGEDEFFDAEESMEWMDGHKENETNTGKDSGQLPNASGRLAPFGDMTLVNHPDTPLYEFVTQNACPMTDDMAQSHQEYLESLSEGERVQAQLASLISDMQAFKAANPLGDFNDFIRWHSPKDWVAEENRVSDRFQLPDNVWIKCWKDALPVPAYNQARLFNETSVAEEVLSSLEDATVLEVAEWLQPCLFLGLSVQLLQKCWPLRSKVEYDKLMNAVLLATRSKKRDDYLEALREMKKMEKMVMFFDSLMDCLHSNVPPAGELIDPPSREELTEFVINLIENSRTQRDNGELNIVPRGVPILGAANSSLGETVRRLMQTDGPNDNPVFPAPQTRQYVLRWMTARPYEGSRLVPQRMFASLEDDVFRLAGSFCDDSLFS